MVVFTLALCVLGACAVTAGALRGARALGLDVLEVLWWLGIAERRRIAPPRPPRRGERPVLVRVK